MNGKMHGKGIYSYGDGATYDGSWYLDWYSTAEGFSITVQAIRMKETLVTDSEPDTVAILFAICLL